MSPTFYQDYNLRHALSQRYICSFGIITCCHREPGHQVLGTTAETVHLAECVVSVVHSVDRYFKFSDSLCIIVIIALPIATPLEYRNTANFALGGFTNCMYHLPVTIAAHSEL